MPPQEWTPWAWYLQQRLRRRIFVWFGIAIAISLAAGGVVRAGGQIGWWPVIAIFGVLWLSSGIIAWRLTRPLVAVVRAARDIGDGKLSTRIELGRRGGGELRILAGAINDMAARIEKQLGDQRQLLAAVSHELRTPLGHMRVLVETARDTGGGEARLLDEIEREVIDLDRLVDRLLASSRLEFDTVDRRQVDLGAVAVVAMETAGVPADRLAVEGDARMEGDPTLLRRAIANLLENAAVHGGGAVAVRVARRAGEAGDELVVEVEDRGPGVAEEARQRLFEPFARGGGGGKLGLGLALVRRIAEAHGGSAWIEDREGGGARAGFAVRAAG